MSEQIMMTEENKKTVVAFIAGLIVGGLLVFIFAEPGASKVEKATEGTSAKNESSESSIKDDDKKEENDTAPKAVDVVATASVVTGEGSIEVEDQAAGQVVKIKDVTFPADAGWIGVRDFDNGQLGGLLGVARWNDAEGLKPSEVSLLRATVAGRTYAVVFYADNGDKRFDLAVDAQIGNTASDFVAK